jgi:hypothetical protein
MAGPARPPVSRRSEPDLPAKGLGGGGLVPFLRGTLGSEPELDVVSFATQILGLRLYPIQRTILRMIFLDLDRMTAFDRRTIERWRTSFDPKGYAIGVPADIWDRIDTLRAEGWFHFREVMLLIGRRGGKNLLAKVVAGYLLYRLIRMDCPQERLGIERDKDLVLFACATNLEQARHVGFRDLATLVSETPWFEQWLVSVGSEEIVLRTPADERRQRQAGREGAVGARIGSIRIRATSTNARGTRGPAGVLAWFDEMAHTPVTPSGMGSGDELYNAVVPALDQAKKLGIVLSTTSPWARTGIAYEIYKQGIAIDEATGRAKVPYILVVQLESWAPFESWDDPEATEGAGLLEPPVVYDQTMAREEARNPQTFAVERRSQWAAVREGFFAPDVVVRLFLPYCPDCGHSFTPGEWERAAGRCPWCEHATVPVTPAFQRAGIPRFAYVGHVDGAERHDAFAVAIAHLETMHEPDGSPVAHVLVDYLHAWSPEDHGGILPYDDIMKDLGVVFRRFPGLMRLSADQFGSPGIVSELRKVVKEAGWQRVRVEKYAHTAANNREREETVKEALATNWIHAPRDTLGPDRSSLLEQEMLHLQLHNGRVIKPTTGPVRSDDMWTAFSVVTHQLLRREYRGGIRAKLAAAPLMASLPGGYHTGSVPDAGIEPNRALSPARARIAAISRATTSIGPHGRRFPRLPAQGLRRPPLP